MFFIAGVYRPMTIPDLYIDISGVRELISFNFSNNTVILGGNITLTDTMKICDGLSKKTGFKYLGQIRDHLEQVAHIPVRNVSGRIHYHLLQIYFINS